MYRYVIGASMDPSSDKELRGALGRRVRQALDLAGVTQAGLARKLRISQSFVSAVSRGASLPSVELVIGLRREGVALDWLLLGEGPQKIGRPPTSNEPPADLPASDEPLPAVPPTSDESLPADRPVGVSLPANEPPLDPWRASVGPELHRLLEDVLESGDDVTAAHIRGFLLGIGARDAPHRIARSA